MRLAIASDTHGYHKRITEFPEADVFVFAGDMSPMGHTKEILSFAKWMKALPYKEKIVIAGNHDWKFYKDRDIAIQLLGDCHYLEDSGCEINGISFWGSPWTVPFCDWAFYLDEQALAEKHWSMIPEDTDILITHGAPQGILDTSMYGKDHTGSHTLLDRVLKIKPLVHIFGHIHEERGWHQFNETLFINTSYDPIFPGFFILEVDKDYAYIV